MSKKHTAHEFTVQESKNILLGQGGCRIMSGAGLLSDVGHWIAFTPLTDNITINTSEHGESGEAMSALQLDTTPGKTIYGSWSRFYITKSSPGGATPVMIIYAG